VATGGFAVEVEAHVQQALDRAALVPDGSDVTTDTRPERDQYQMSAGSFGRRHDLPAAKWGSPALFRL